MTIAMKEVLAATSAAFADDPTLAAASVAAGAQLGGACTVEVRVGDRSVAFDMPEPLGGTDEAPSPGQLALASLGACQAITYRIWSEKLGIRVDELRVDIDGDIDVRGLLGLEDAVRPGFGKVDVKVHLAGPEQPDRYEELRQAVNEHCPVLDVFAGHVPVSTSLTLR